MVAPRHFDIGGELASHAEAATRYIRTKGETRDVAFGTSASQCSSRTTCMAAPVSRWWRCVCAAPPYRDRRTAQARTLWAIVPATPARLASAAVKVAVRARSRPACQAAWWCAARSVIVRRMGLERVHLARRGHRCPSGVAPVLVRTALVPRSSAGVPRTLLFPAGHRACCLAQASSTAPAATPGPACACHCWARRVGPLTAIPDRAVLATTTCASHPR